MQYKLSELVAKFGGRLVGADVTVSAIAPTDLAAHGEITFYQIISTKSLAYLQSFGDYYQRRRCNRCFTAADYHTKSPTIILAW